METHRKVLCKDRLPKESGRYFVIGKETGGHYTAIFYTDQTNKWHPDSHLQKPSDIDAWLEPIQQSTPDSSGVSDYDNLIFDILYKHDCQEVDYVVMLDAELSAITSEIVAVIQSNPTPKAEPAQISEIEGAAKKYMASGETIGGGDSGWIKAAFIDGAKWAISKQEPISEERIEEVIRRLTQKVYMCSDKSLADQYANEAIKQLK